MMLSAVCTSAVRLFPSGSTGKERDTESGNDYFGARYYSSAMGRFLIPDWSAKAEPVPYAKMDNPQTLNLYAYLRNNPLAGVDADGHCPAAEEAACEQASAVYNKTGDAGAAVNAGQQAQQQNGNGTSLPSSLAMATPSVGGIISTVKKLFGFGKDAKDTLDAGEQFSFWGKMQAGHLKMLQRDMGNSKDADPMHIGVDYAHLKLDEAERGYYSTKMALTASGASGGIMFPQLGDGVLFQLKTQIDAAVQNLSDETAAYNRAVGAQ